MGNATAPLNSLWETLGNQLNLSGGLNEIQDFLNPDGKAPVSPRLKSTLGGRLSSLNTLESSSISAWEILSKVKVVFVFIAQMSVAILEVVLRILKSIVSLVT